MAWTRVKDLELVTSQRIQVFDVEADLQADKSLKQVRKGAIRELGKILFDPDQYKDMNYQFSIDRHRLNTDELQIYAEMASEIR